MTKWMIVSSYLRDGKYLTPDKLNWHERVRIKLALWLFRSIPKPFELEVKTETGTSSKDLNHVLKSTGI